MTNPKEMLVQAEFLLHLVECKANQLYVTEQDEQQWMEQRDAWLDARREISNNDLVPTCCMCGSQHMDMAPPIKREKENG